MDRTELLRASPPMFKSGRLDRFTRVHHLVPVVIFLPPIVLLFGTALGRLGLLELARSTRSAGYALWTLAEYWIHRLIFHFEPADGIGARVHWMIHGVHHDHPNDPSAARDAAGGIGSAGAGLLRGVLARARRRPRGRHSAPASWAATSPTT